MRTPRASSRVGGQDRAGVDHSSASAGAPPQWFADFLRYMAQMRLNSDGELETLKPDDWLALREWMRAVRRASAGQDTPYLRILRRFVPE